MHWARSDFQRSTECILVHAQEIPRVQRKEWGYYDRGPLLHIVYCDIESRGRISTVPPPGTRSVSGCKVRSQDKGVDIAGENERLERGPLSQYHEILCCSRESRTGVGGVGDRGERERRNWRWREIRRNVGLENARANVRRR